MDESADLPNLPGHVTVKDAAKMLGLAEKTVYEYVKEKRIRSFQAGRSIVIPLEEVEKFKPNVTGRPRKALPEWRISPEDNTLLSTEIVVQMRAGQRDRLLEKLREIKQHKEHLFPGTVERYIIGSETQPERVQILLVWRGALMPPKQEREEALQEFRRALADVLDWSTATYEHGRVYMHT